MPKADVVKLTRTAKPENGRYVEVPLSSFKFKTIRGGLQYCKPGFIFALLRSDEPDVNRVSAVSVLGDFLFKDSDGNLTITRTNPYVP